MDNSALRKKLAAAKFVAPDQAFKIECMSLRPYTRFYVIFDKLDYSAFCAQEGKRLGEPLISDGYGKLNFTFYWTRSNEAEMAQNNNFIKYFDMTVGNKPLTITDKSGTSYINKTIFFTNNNPEIIFNQYTKPSNITIN